MKAPDNHGFLCHVYPSRTAKNSYCGIPRYEQACYGRYDFKKTGTCSICGFKKCQLCADSAQERKPR